MTQVIKTAHYKNVCKDCGTVLSQCRCPSGDKITRQIDGPCDNCRTNTQHPEAPRHP